MGALVVALVLATPTCRSFGLGDRRACLVATPTPPTIHISGAQRVTHPDERHQNPGYRYSKVSGRSLVTRTSHISS